MTECVNCAKFKGCDLSSPNVNECADYKEILTNEEWLRICSTEEFAEWIASEINERVKLALHDSELNDGDVDADFYMEDSDDWKEWLKQPHHEKE